MEIKQLIIAEKADMGRAIADFLWPNKAYVDKQRYLEKDGIVVSWAAGHLYYLAAPAEYGYSSWNYYPVYPDNDKWIIKSYANKVAQLNTLKELLKYAKEVIHAGDPDREGQAIVDTILEQCQYKGIVKRLMLSAKDDISLKRAFANLDDNKHHYNMYLSAQARARADWLVGMNLSRCYQEQAKKFGLNERWRVGRVKMPTLALVVRRERELQGFKKHYYYELEAIFEKNNLPIRANLVPSPNINLDENGKIREKSVLQAIMTKVKMSNGIVKSYKNTKGEEYPPLPYSMDKLQVEANKKYKLSPKKVLDIVESLYLAKVVSYPRSDCNYIPKSQLEDAPRIMAALDKYGIKESTKADIKFVGKAWDDSKITAHHAIIPTGVVPSNLSDEQDKVYRLIAERYIMQFLHPCKFEKAEYTIMTSDEMFKGSAKRILDYGFKGTSMAEKATDDKDVIVDSIPVLSEGETLNPARECRILDKETKPPKRYTAGTLISAMTDIWRYMDINNPNREKLKKIKGLGTPATRDSIIEDLLATTVNGKKTRPMLQEVKNELVPTSFGFYVADNIAPSLMEPDATALMEYQLSEIEAGNYNLADFMQETRCMVNENIDYAEKHKFGSDPDEKVVECPRCHNGVLVKRYNKTTKEPFFICNNEDCKNPFNSKPYYYNADKDGEPIIGYCPTCKGILDRAKGPYGFFWKCSKCNKNYRDNNGKPDFTIKKHN